MSSNDYYNNGNNNQGERGYGGNDNYNQGGNQGYQQQGGNQGYQQQGGQEGYGNEPQLAGQEGDRGLGTSILGAAAGGFAGHKMGGNHSKLETIGGAIIGAIGANWAKDKFDDRKDNKRWEQQNQGYGGPPQGQQSGGFFSREVGNDSQNSFGGESRDERREERREEYGNQGNQGGYGNQGNQGGYNQGGQGGYNNNQGGNDNRW